MRLIKIAITSKGDLKCFLYWEASVPGVIEKRSYWMQGKIRKIRFAFLKTKGVSLPGIEDIFKKQRPYRVKERLFRA
jgi:hypothetical protein